MAEPVFSTTTERLYSRLPELYRTADEPLGWPLKRYIALVVDEAGAIEELLDRIDRRELDEGGLVGDVAELVEPTTADPAWLPWLAQLVGVRLAPGLTIEQQRDAIATASAGWRAGTKEAIRLAAQTQLTGTRYVEVIDHAGGDPWAISVRTRSDETADQAAVIQAIRDFRAKPAGLLLVAAFYAASWDVLEAEYPSWDAIEAAGSWDALELTQP